MLLPCLAGWDIKGTSLLFLDTELSFVIAFAGILKERVCFRDTERFVAFAGILKEHVCHFRMQKRFVAFTEIQICGFGI